MNRTRLAWLAQLAVACLGCGRGGGGDPPLPHPYALAQALDTMAQASREVWPGFVPARVPLAVYDGTRTWVFRHPASLAGFTPDDTLRATQVFAGRHPLMRANTSVDWEGVRTATVLVDTAENPGLRAWASVAVHEAFHVFQRAHYRRWGGNDAYLFLYPVTNALNLELRREETAALRAAMRAPDVAERACWARVALQARKERFGFLDSASVAYERGTEMLEGLADYVAARATGTDVAPPRAFYRAEDVRGRSYAVGAAMAAVLDDLSPAGGAEWRAALAAESDRWLDDLFEAALARKDDAGRRCGLVPAQQRALHAQAVLDVQDLEARRRSRRQAFLEAPGWRVVIEAEDAPVFPRQFDPLNVFRLNDREVLHDRHLVLANESGAVEILDRTSLTVGDVSHPLFAGVIRVTITGMPTQPMVRDSSGMLLVDGDGVTGRFRGAVARVEEGGRVTRVQMGE